MAVVGLTGRIANRGGAAGLLLPESIPRDDLPLSDAPKVQESGQRIL
jgi:hypothetical protein